MLCPFTYTFFLVVGVQREPQLISAWNALPETSGLSGRSTHSTCEFTVSTLWEKYIIAITVERYLNNNAVEYFVLKQITLNDKIITIP